MVLNNKVYDILKWVALIVLPAVALFYQTVAAIWGWPYVEQIPETIAAAELFIGALIGISSNTYKKSVKS